jgi:hypothetical protein
MEELKNDIKIEMRDNKVRPDRIYGFMLRILELLSLRSTPEPEPVAGEATPEPVAELVADSEEATPEPEPEPVAEEATPEPEPEPEPVAEEAAPEPEPEPVADSEEAEEEAEEPEPEASAEGDAEPPKKSKKSRR